MNNQASSALLRPLSHDFEQRLSAAEGVLPLGKLVLMVAAAVDPSHESHAYRTDIIERVRVETGCADDQAYTPPHRCPLYRTIKQSGVTGDYQSSRTKRSTSPKERVHLQR